MKYPKLKYKGPTNTPKMLTIPSNVAPSASLDVSSEEANAGEKNPSTHVSPCPVPGDSLECVNGTNGKSKKNIKGAQEHEKANKEATNEDASQELLCEPKFDIVYRNGLELGKFWMDSTIDLTTQSETPKEILLRVFLPKVMNASEVELDVSDTQAILTVPGLYKLQVKWRYVVDSMKGSAKFDKAGHKLEVLLPTRATFTCPT